MIYNGGDCMHTEINIDLQDTEWELDYIDHDRNIARAIVYDESGQFYFCLLYTSPSPRDTR